MKRYMHAYAYLLYVYSLLSACTLKGSVDTLVMTWRTQHGLAYAQKLAAADWNSQIKNLGIEIPSDKPQMLPLLTDLGSSGCTPDRLQQKLCTALSKISNGNDAIKFIQNCIDQVSFVIENSSSSSQDATITLHTDIAQRASDEILLAVVLHELMHVFYDISIPMPLSSSTRDAYRERMKREFRADAMAAFASKDTALILLRRNQGAFFTLNPVTACDYIAHYLLYGCALVSNNKKLLPEHPPVIERVCALNTIYRQHGNRGETVSSIGAAVYPVTCMATGLLTGALATVGMFYSIKRVFSQKGA